MESKKVLRYYADCGRGFWRKDQAINHEGNCKCWKNPKNKACKTCKFGEYAPFENDTGFGGFWECYHESFSGPHKGAPKGIDYISVNCEYHDYTRTPYDISIMDMKP